MARCTLSAVHVGMEEWEAAGSQEELFLLNLSTGHRMPAHTLCVLCLFPSEFSPLQEVVAA